MMRRYNIKAAMNCFTTVPLYTPQRGISGSIVWGLTSEQESFVQMAREFSQKEFAPYADKWDNEKFFPKEALKKCAEQGFAGMYCPEELGGGGMTRHDASLVFEQLAMSDPSTTAFLTIHNMANWMVSRFANNDEQRELVGELCKMDKIASYCLTEASSGSDAAALKTKAVDAGDYWEVTGSKSFISGGGASDIYVTMVRTGDETAKGISCVIIKKEDEGVSFGAQERKMGWNSQPTCMVNFEKVKVPKTRLLGKEGEGFKIAMKGLDGGRVNIATSSLGAAQRCLELSTEYVKDRKQFGQPIATFQNTQFKLADIAAKVHSSRLMIRQAANAVDAGNPDATVYCAMAKMMATEQCFSSVDDCLQLFGGYGYLKDFPIERYLRDLRVHRILEGTNEIMRMIVSRNLLK